MRVQALYRATIDITKWFQHQYFEIDIRGVGSVAQFTAWPDRGLESIEGESLLMPLLEGEAEYPNDYPEMRGLFLERVEDGVYRRKGAWRIGGSYSAEGLGADAWKVIRMWHATGPERSADRSKAGLDEGEFAGLWDGEAYILKII
jgi:hypothetical protein